MKRICLLSFPSLKIFFFSFSCCLIFNSSFTQSITFEKYYDYGFAEAGNAVQQTSDGGYIIFGRQGITFGVSKVLLIKTDSDGQEQWHKLIGGNNNDNQGYAGQQTSDGGYIIAGFNSILGYMDNIYLVKTNSDGDTLWTKSYGGSKSDIGWSVQQTTDGGYIVAGHHNDSLPCLLKTDAQGDTLWFKDYLPTGYNSGIAYSVQQTNDGGYVTTGFVYSSTSSDDLFIVKTDSNGDTLWTKTYGGTDATHGQCIKQTSDGGYIIAGGEGGFPPNYWDFFWMKTDSNGDTVWAKSYGGTSGEELYSVVESTDGNYFFAGIFDNASNGLDIILIKADNNGDTIWTKAFGDASHQFNGYDGCLKQTSDGGFVISGLTDQGFASAFLIKTDSTGYAPNGIYGFASEENELIIYPNPFSNSATLILPSEYSDDVLSIVVFDVTGRELSRSEVNRQKQVKIERDNLEKGVYFIKFFSQLQIIATAKIIIQ